MQQVRVERMTAEELSALTAYDLGLALNEVVEASALCSRLSRAVRDRILKAKIAVLNAATSDDLRIARIEKLTAETELQHIRDRATMLRTASSILQSLLRAANIV